ncbi:MAG: hypothetical protein IPJ18_11680 [Betaproteobacteria bacterium]|nr:hypothetical protein [Betaproteobacteria bacterium]
MSIENEMTTHRGACAPESLMDYYQAIESASSNMLAAAHVGRGGFIPACS